MSDFDQLIAKVASQMSRDSKEMQEICEKTLEDYQILETLDVGGAGPLRMIAWDRKCSS